MGKSKIDVRTFNNPEFGNVRTVIINNEVWFVGKDVALILGYSDTFGALKKHIDDEDKQNCQNDSFESNRGLTVINESGFYSLVLSSKLPNAKRFKRWVTNDVLPSLRKTGEYRMNPESEPLFIEEKALHLNNTKPKQEYGLIRSSQYHQEIIEKIKKNMTAIDVLIFQMNKHNVRIEEFDFMMKTLVKLGEETETDITRFAAVKIPATTEYKY